MLICIFALTEIEDVDPQRFSDFLSSKSQRVEQLRFLRDKSDLDVAQAVEIKKAYMDFDAAPASDGSSEPSAPDQASSSGSVAPSAAANGAVAAAGL